jgi:hypothetical protein
MIVIRVLTITLFTKNFKLINLTVAFNKPDLLLCRLYFFLKKVKYENLKRYKIAPLGLSRYLKKKGTHG